MKNNKQPILLHQQQAGLSVEQKSRTSKQNNLNSHPNRKTEKSGQHAQPHPTSSQQKAYHKPEGKSKKTSAVSSVAQEKKKHRAKRKSQDNIGDGFAKSLQSSKVYQQIFQYKRLRQLSCDHNFAARISPEREELLKKGGQVQKCSDVKKNSKADKKSGGNCGRQNRRFNHNLSNSRSDSILKKKSKASPRIVKRIDKKISHQPSPEERDIQNSKKQKKKGNIKRFLEKIQNMNETSSKIEFKEQHYEASGGIYQGQKQSVDAHERIYSENMIQHEVSAENTSEDQKICLTSENPEKTRVANQNDSQGFYRCRVGDRIADRYEILGVIEKGSFGEVFKVLDIKTKEKLALKMLKQSKELEKQFFVEISILTHIRGADSCNTSGIVRINDFFVFENHICILFELLAGNLYELLQQTDFKGLPEDVVRVFAMQLLNSLNFLRRQKIIHCDLKPENVSLTKKGKAGIKLIDFGTSCFQGGQLYTYLQSRYYRSPEVMSEMPYSYPIDMWSFGCILFELITGEPLFKAASKLQQMLQISSCIGLPRKQEGLYSLALLSTETFKKISSNSSEIHYEKFDKRYLATLQQRLADFAKPKAALLTFLKAILVWEPEKRLTPEEALSHIWVTKGLTSEMQSIYSSISTVESRSKSKKTSKQTSKESRTSSNRSKKGNPKKIKKDEFVQMHSAENPQKNKIKFERSPGKNNPLLEERSQEIARRSTKAMK